MTHILSDIHVSEVSLVERGADQDAFVVLFKSADAVEEEVIEQKGASMADLNEDLQKALEGVTGAEGFSPEVVEALNAFVASRPVVEEAGTGGTTEVEAKTLTEEPQVEEPKTEATTVIVNTAEADITKSAGWVAMEKRLQDAEVALAKAKEDAEVSALTDRVKAEAASLSLNSEEVAKTLHRISETDRETIMGVLKGASKIVEESGLFKEVGTASEGTATDGFSVFVQKIMTETPGITKSAAMAKALETAEGKDLYRKTLA